MFAWYRDSCKCYVYLSDVEPESLSEYDLPWLFGDPRFHSQRHDDGGYHSAGTECYESMDRPWDPRLWREDERCSLLQIYQQLARSRWFTRGWTLQELLAPSDVEFFCKSWTSLGGLDDLVDVISEITGIKRSVLRKEERIKSCSVACRMSWAARRKTTRIEDEAYSLLGLFGINMPLLYGEGSMAFIRLQKEIIQASPDQSILAWQRSPYDREPTPGFGYYVFARSVAKFVGCQSISPCVQPHGRHALQITHLGVKIHGCLLNAKCYGDAVVVVVLNCLNVRQPHKLLALYARHLRSGEVDEYVVSSPSLWLIPLEEIQAHGHTSGVVLCDYTSQQQAKTGADLFRFRCITDNPLRYTVSLLEAYPRRPWAADSLLRIESKSKCAFKIRINERLGTGEPISTVLTVAFTLWPVYGIFVEEWSEDSSSTTDEGCAQLNSEPFALKNTLEYRPWVSHDVYQRGLRCCTTTRYNIRLTTFDEPRDDGYPQIILLIDKRLGMLRTLGSAPRILLGAKTQRFTKKFASRYKKRTRNHWLPEFDFYWPSATGEYGFHDKPTLTTDRWSLFGSSRSRYLMLLTTAWQQSSLRRVFRSSDLSDSDER